MTKEEEKQKKSNKSVRLCFAIFLVLSDIVLVTILYGHLKELRKRLLIDFYSFNPRESLIEFWLLGITRGCILLGASIGMLKNSVYTKHRCAKYSWLPLTFAVASWVYMMTKMLMYTEYYQDLKQPWFWSLFGWSCFANVLFTITWKLIGSVTLSHEETEAFSINSDETPLIKDEKEEKKNEDEEEEGPNVSKSKTVGRLLKYTLPDLPLLLIAMLFMCLSSTASIFLPFYTGEVINQITIEKSKTKFVRSIIIMALLSAGSSVAAGIRGGFFKVCMAKLHIRICNVLFGALVTQEIGFYDKKKTGEITSRLTSDTDTVSQVLTLNMNIFLRSMIQAIGTCVFMFGISWRLSMVTFMGLPIIITVSNLYGDYYKNLQKKVQDTLAEANSVAEEACSTMRTVRSFANELQEAICYRDKLQKTYSVKRKEAVAYAGYMWCSELFALSLVVATLYYGGHLVIAGEISGGNLISFILYQMQLGNVLESIAWVYTGIMQAVGASENVFKLIDREPKIKHNAGTEKPEAFKGHIRFKDVSFNYPTRPDNPVLKDLSFEVKPGEVVALVGPSGGGKSTCVSLLEHFYQVQNGQITIDGISIQDYDHKYLHHQISLVGQEPVLYARSIEKNIAYGLDDWEMNQVENAAKMANAHNFISEMKDSYQTEAGEKGTQLSGGQKQRVAIARALIHNPKILLLDEATSALDSESEYMVQEAIYNNMKGRTVIVIAHRLSTVERADRILVIDKGKLIEQGSHAQLLEQGGLYSQLVSRQLTLGFGVDSPSAGEPQNHVVTKAHTPLPHADTTFGSYRSLASFGSVTEAEIHRSPKMGSPYSQSIEYGTPIV